MGRKIEVDVKQKILIDKIINQMNSLNKKLKAFEKQGITSHREYVNNFLGDLVEYNDSGSVTKSKKYYASKNNLELEKILTVAKKVNNHYAYGTVKKFNTQLTATLEKTKDYARNLLIQKGYSEEWVDELVNDKGFMVRLLDGFGARSKSFGSDQVIEKVALNYKEHPLGEDEAKRLLNDLEANRLAQERILEEQRLVEEYRNARQR